VFTGIIETTGIVKDLTQEGTNLHLRIETALASNLQIDQSVAHNGICLTVVEIKDDTYVVTAIEETLLRTNLNQIIKGDSINLERCMPATGRYDGHMVQGHVDDIATCTQIENRDGSWLFTFEINRAEHNKLMVEKGSICVNGISLTIAKTNGRFFTVAIIPYTYEHTNLQYLRVGNFVNIEFDIIGKYVQKMLAARNII
jgi:riboflavin synthase